MDVNPSMEPPVAASKRYSVVAPADAYNVVAPSVQIWHRIANANTTCYNLVVKKGETMVKTANLYARIEPELKNEAESILGDLGVPVSNAINMFYRQIVIHRGLPFSVKLPSTTLLNAATLTEQQLDKEVAKGFSDIANGRKRSLKDAVKSLSQELSL